MDWQTAEAGIEADALFDPCGCEGVNGNEFV